jgi:Lsr2
LDRRVDTPLQSATIVTPPNTEQFACRQRRSRFEVRLTDDLSGTEIPSGKGEMVTFSLDGTSYEIDLTAKNASVLRKELRPYIAAGRPIQGSRRRHPVRTKVGADARTVKGVGSRQWLPGARARAIAK